MKKRSKKVVSTDSELTALITACTLKKRSFIAINLLKEKSEPGKSTLAHDHIGYIGNVLHGLKQLGVSKEALVLLSKVGKSQDDIGELDCFKTNDGKLHFAWLGSIFGKKIIEIAEGNDLGSSTYTAPTEADVTIIPNDFPQEAKEVVEELFCQEQEARC